MEEYDEAAHLHWYFGCWRIFWRWVFGEYRTIFWTSAKRWTYPPRLRYLEVELLRAPAFVRELLASIPSEYIEHLRLTSEAIELADGYIEAKVVGKTSRADCQHIAMATLSNADVLVSWNFKHIVNLDRIRGYNSVNHRFGYKMIEIRTPKEIEHYGYED
jgi:hypothetical protein